MSQTAMRFTPRYPVVSYGGWQGAGGGYGAPIQAATSIYVPADAVAAPSPGITVPDALYDPATHWSNQDVQVAFDPYAQLRQQRQAYRQRLENVEAQLATRDRQGGGRMKIPWWGYVLAAGVGYFLWKRVKA